MAAIFTFSHFIDRYGRKIQGCLSVCVSVCLYMGEDMMSGIFSVLSAILILGNMAFQVCLSICLFALERQNYLADFN